METTPVYDLHAHTTVSDGQLTPGELVRAAATSGLSAIAVTDHDTVEGIPGAIEEAEQLGVEIVSGVEVSATFRNVAVHVLGLFVEHREPWLQKFFSEAKERRVERVHRIVERLGRVGVVVDPRQVFAKSGHGTVGRPHVAEVLVEQGVVATMTDAFDAYLGENGPAYVGYDRVSFEDAVGLIRRAGGVSSLAHPVLLNDDALIPDMAALELSAIEVFHHEQNPAKRAEYAELARRLGLLVSGGSDFHRPDASGETHLGCELPPEAFDALRRAAGSA